MQSQGLRESSKWRTLVRTNGGAGEAGFERFCKCLMLNVPGVDSEFIRIRCAKAMGSITLPVVREFNVSSAQRSELLSGRRNAGCQGARPGHARDCFEAT